MSIQNQPTAEQFAVIQAVANFSAKPMRTPILKTLLTTAWPMKMCSSLLWMACRLRLGTFSRSAI